MSFNRNINLKIIGFFGQSGAGKTTTIRNVKRMVNNQVVLHNTGIIRYLFRKNSTSYLNPKQIVREHFDKVQELDEKQKALKIDELYEKYIRSQLQLLNDWSTEVYLATKESYSTPSILLVDRSPIDFYALTVCGMNYLQEKFEKPISYMAEYYVKLVKNVATDNTNNFLNGIFVVKPWKTSNINNLKDGIRDQYLEDYYIDENWYSRYDEVELKDVATFYVEQDIIDLQERADLVFEKLSEV